MHKVPCLDFFYVCSMKSSLQKNWRIDFASSSSSSSWSSYKTIRDVKGKKDGTFWALRTWRKKKFFSSITSSEKFVFDGNRAYQEIGLPKLCNLWCNISLKSGSIVAMAPNPIIFLLKWRNTSFCYCAIIMMASQLLTAIFLLLIAPSMKHSPNLFHAILPLLNCHPTSQFTNDASFLVNCAINATFTKPPYWHMMQHFTCSRLRNKYLGWLSTQCIFALLSILVNRAWKVLWW